MTKDPEYEPDPDSARPVEDDTQARHAAYWRRNLRVLWILLAVWFVVSYGLGILLAEPLGTIRIPGTGFPVGFWFAQQGSIYVFVVLTFAYAWLMNGLDRRYGVDEGVDS